MQVTKVSQTIQDDTPLAVVLSEREQIQMRIRKAQLEREEQERIAREAYEKQAADDLALLAEIDRREREAAVKELITLKEDYEKRYPAFRTEQLALQDNKSRQEELKRLLGPVQTVQSGVVVTTPAESASVVDPVKNTLLWRTKSRSKGGKVESVRYGVFPETLNTTTLECYDYDAHKRVSVKEYLAQNGFTE